MQSRFSQTLQVTVTTNRNANGTLNGAPTTNHITDFSDQFTVLQGANVKGNRKSPNPNAFSRDVLSALIGRHFIDRRTVDFPRYTEVTGVVGEAHIAPAGYSSTAVNTALSNLHEAYRGHADWAVTLLEGGQVASMVRNAFQVLRYARSFRVAQLADWYRAYVRLKNRRERVDQATRVAANKWLEFQYGWRPLAQDLYNTAVELSRMFPPLMVLEGRGYEVVRQDIPHNSPFQGAGTASYTHQMRCLIKCRFRPPVSMAQLLANFTSLNPASLVWETLPFSFVVDWVYDIGGYLRNLESTLLSRSQFVDGFITEGYYSHSVTACNRTVVINGYENTINAAGWSSRRGKRRSVLSSLPFPRAPSFRLNLGGQRLISAAALLRQQFR